MNFKIIISIVLLSLASCDSLSRNVYKKVFYRMDTVVELTLILEESVLKVPFSKKRVSESERIFNKIDSLLEDFEVRFSQNSSESEILHLNQRASQNVQVSDELYQMLRLGQSYGDTLNGDFDITLLPLKELWGFGKGEGRKTLPPKDSIILLLENVNYKMFEMQDNKNIKFANSNIFVDCGGIAKGVAIEEMGKLLNRLGVKDYLISAGGDILGIGERVDNKPWKLGIKHPRSNDKPLAIFELTNGAVVTSGDYERYVEYDGKKYHHLFNMKTGYPAKKNVSVTIYSESPVIADILSTGLFSRSADEIIEFIEKREKLECVVVDKDGKVFISEGWKNSIKLL